MQDTQMILPAWVIFNKTNHLSITGILSVLFSCFFPSIFAQQLLKAF